MGERCTEHLLDYGGRTETIGTTALFSRNGPGLHWASRPGCPGTLGSVGGTTGAGFLTCSPNGNVFISKQDTFEILEFQAGTAALIGSFATLPGRPFGLEFGPNVNLFVGVQGGVVGELTRARQAVLDPQ